MSVVWSFIFDKLTDPLDLPLPLWQQWLILGIIGLIAFALSFKVVGGMYDNGEISSGFAGTLFHWIIRFFLFVALWTVTYGVIVIGKFIYAHWVLALIVVAGLIVIGVVVWLIHRKKVFHA